MSVSVRTCIAVVAAATAAAFAGAGSQAAGADAVRLNVRAYSIDGSLSYRTSGGWTWTCTGSWWCGIQAARGTTVTITASSGGASPFILWGGACASFGSQPTCTVQVDAETDVTATFGRVRIWLPTFGYGKIQWSVVDQGVLSPFGGRSCGTGCVDLPNGATVRLHARPDDGYRLGAWGGDCVTTSRTSDCTLTLHTNGTVAATFEVPPPPTDCRPGQSCDPIGPAIPYRVIVKGNGTVTAPKMKTIAQVTCRSLTTSGSFCPVDRPIEKRLYFVATGLRFQGWDGACAGQSSNVCSLYSKTGTTDTTVIARFA